MPAPRSVIDYSLARRSTLSDLFAGRLSTVEVCDAHPYLLRAAKWHGEPTEADCPVCRRSKLTNVIYVYGDELGSYAGRVKTRRELPSMAEAYGEFTVYVVEVCQGCAWNHLSQSYVLGHGRTTHRRRSRTGAASRAAHD
jgi:hypothetical protein